MKKRIFISMHYMELGGAEMSLIGLLKALDYTMYEVDLFIHRHQGELMSFIPNEVKLLPEITAYACIESTMTEALRRGQLGIVWGRMKAKWRALMYKPQNASKPQNAIFQYIAQEVEPYLPTLEQFGEYDLAISFLHPHIYVLSKVVSKKKTCWIHTDYTRVELDVKAELPIWSAYDHIVSISPDVTKAFLLVFPLLSNKIVEIENILSSDFVRKRAEDVNEDGKWNANLNIREKIVKVLSVGRFVDAKNFDNVPDICQRIRKLGVNIYWYLIGYGGDEKLIRQRIHETGMEEYVFILGKRTNPYPYIKGCDIYVQPSRYEGKSVTVREAQMLYKPVAVTNYPTAKSQIQDGVDGVIVPMDNDGCAKGIAGFICNKDLQEQIVDYLHSHDYGNVSGVKKIEKLLN